MRIVLPLIELLTINIFCVAKAYNNKRVVWLFGDSIIDNSYWHDVETETTGEVLRELLSNDEDNVKNDSIGIDVKDRSTEELDSLLMLTSIKNRKPIQVAKVYVDHRNEIGIPYDDAPTGAVTITPEELFGSDDSNKNENDKDNFVVFSIGGNDVVLLGEIDTLSIVKRLKEIISNYRDIGSVLSSRIFYVIPYSPTNETVQLMKSKLGIHKPKEFYSRFVSMAKNMCVEEGINCIALDHFTDRERLATKYGIPEPTKEGAKALAILIQQSILECIRIEEEKTKNNNSNSNNAYSEL